MRWANGKMYLSDTYYAKAKANLWPLNWIEIDLLLRQAEVARCPLPVACCPTPFSVDVSVQLSLPLTQKSMLRFWWPDKRVTGDKPRGKLATAIYELVVSCQLIMFMCDGETTASSVRQTEAETERGRESVRQRWIKRGKLQTARKETNRMSHVDLNNWSLTWIIATPRAACPRWSIVVASGGARSVDVRGSSQDGKHP